MPYGLTGAELQRLVDVFAVFPHVERAVLYGSRAKGTFKPFSDIDVTLVGDELSRSDLVDILLRIDDLLLPYRCDISLFHTLKNEELIDHIRRVGVEIYRKGE